jgi:G3E family GTPase
VVSSEEEIIELMNGCVCCTVRQDLIVTIKKLLKMKGKAGDGNGKPFDAIIIETTGLADPAPVAQTFFMDEVIAAKCRLDAIITVVDAKHIIQHLDEVKPEGVENESVEQVAFADRIVLNKIDLVTDINEIAAVKARLRSINSVATIIESDHSRVDANLLLQIDGFSLDRVMEKEPDFLAED